MPLLKGSDIDTIQKNITKLINEGYPQKQAVAIAYNSADKSKGEKK